MVSMFRSNKTIKSLREPFSIDLEMELSSQFASFFFNVGTSMTSSFRDRLSDYFDILKRILVKWSHRIFVLYG